MTTERTITAYGPDDIYIDGLTKGPRAGWTWDGRALNHPAGIRIELTDAAAARVTAAVDACRRIPDERLTGYQLAKLPEAARAQYEYSHYYDVHGIYVKRGSTTPGTTTIDVAEVAAVVNAERP